MNRRTPWFALTVLAGVSCTPDQESLTAPPPSLGVMSGAVTCDVTVAAGGGGDHTTIQAGIDNATSGETICVYPGNYSETATNRTISNGNGPHQFGLFLPADKPGLTIVGVDGSGNAITDAAATVATVGTNATNNFGYSGIFVDAADVTIQGLTIGPNTAGDNKTIEIIKDNFTLAHVRTAIPGGGGSIYFGDWSALGDVLKEYHLLDNRFTDGTSIDLSNGAGLTGLAGSREILRNVFDLSGGFWPAISFNGSGSGVPWFLTSVGGATIQDNSFSNGTDQYIRARGTYDNTQFDWESYWQDNTFDKAAIVLEDDVPFVVRTYSYASGAYTFNNVRRIGPKIQGEIQDLLPPDYIVPVQHAQPGDIILVKAGVYPERVDVDRRLTIRGPNAGVPGNAARSPEAIVTGSASGAFVLSASDATIDGFRISSAVNGMGAGIHMAASFSGTLISNSVLAGNQIGVYANSAGPSTIRDNLFDGNNQPGAAGGSGIYSEQTDHLTIRDNEFRNHSVNNPVIFAATAAAAHKDLTFTGNNVHDNISGVYVLGVDGGLFSGNTLSTATGTAISFGGGSNTDVIVTLNRIQNSLRGVRFQDFGYGLGDDNGVRVNRNAITGNTQYGINLVSGYNGVLDAECNWYGSASGPANAGNPGGTGDLVAGTVDFTPWLSTSSLAGACGAPVVSNVAVTPNPAPYTTSGYTLTATATDNVAVTSASYTIDGVLPATPFPAFSQGASVQLSAAIGQLGVGVYEFCVTAQDADDNLSNTECTMLAVYDPTAGFVTGGGWITSPDGAYPADPTLVGRATFGFVSKYVKGKALPTGNTEFQFQAGSLNFSSTSYEWLVVSGARAQYKGVGTVNGAGSYGFLLTAIDGQLNGGGGYDKFRIKIWEIGGDVVYDNQIGDADGSAPTTTLGGGSIVIHVPKK